MSFPSMRGVLKGFSKPVELTVVKKTLVDFDVAETAVATMKVVGLLVPASPRKVLMKPEGQRTWKWLDFYTEKALTLDWVMRDKDGREYRIMGVSDWSIAGFYQYDLAESAPMSGATSPESRP